MNNPQAALIWCPFANEAEAAEVANRLLDEGLIACANLMPGMRSLYRWQGAAGESSECGALLKTTAERLPAAIARLEALHPYDAPAILGWAAERSGTATANWLGNMAAIRA